jgi:membrane protease subunit HflK
MNGGIHGVPKKAGKPPEVPIGIFGIGIAALLLLVLGSTTVYTVEPDEVGVVLTFGKFSHMAPPGLQFKLPTPIQSVFKVPMRRQLKQEFGFRTRSAGVITEYINKGLEGEALMLTGDLNVGVVEWTTQYRIDDPYKALFKVRNLTETFRDMNEAVMRAVVGDRSVTELLTIGREEISSEVGKRLQELCDQYETGLTIGQVVLQDVNPPEQVKPSFDEVNQAQQERERMINEALAAFNRVVPRARGEALQMIQAAEGYSTDRKNRAKGDAALFDSLLAAYRRSPEVTRQRIYLETMQTVLPGIKRKVIVDESMQGLIPLLSLGEGVTK